MRTYMFTRLVVVWNKSTGNDVMWLLAIVLHMH